MELPSIIKLKTFVFLPSNEGFFNSEFTSARRKLRRILKGDFMAKKMNLPFDILSEIKPAILIHARLNTLPYNLFESKFTIETDKIESKVDGKSNNKVYCGLISKEYLVNYYSQNGGYTTLKITPIKNLENFKKGKSVKFEKITYFTDFVEICYQKTIIV